MTYTANSMPIFQFGLHSLLSDSSSRLSIQSLDTFLCLILIVLIVTKVFVIFAIMRSFIDPFGLSHHLFGCQTICTSNSTLRTLKKYLTSKIAKAPQPTYQIPNS